MQIQNQTSAPLQIPRSTTTTFRAMITLNDTTQFNQVTYSWSVRKNMSTISISMAGNPTTTTSQFTLPSNTLEYGVYVITVMASLPGCCSSQNFTYLSVVPTGIVVLSMPYFYSILQLGVNQSVALSPSVYSFDPDNMVDVSLLSYKFYCQQVDISLSGINYLINNMTNLTDLATGLTGSDQCFSGTSNSHFLTNFTFSKIFNKLSRWIHV